MNASTKPANNGEINQDSVPQNPDHTTISTRTEELPLALLLIHDENRKPIDEIPIS